MNTIQTIAIISPFVSAALTAYLTFQFTSKSKRLDILYQNKVPAFKEISANIISFKNFCGGRVAYYNASEFHPFLTDSLGTLEYRTKIAYSIEANIVFISKNARVILSDFINQMGMLCHIELTIAVGENDLDCKCEYQRMSALAEQAIEYLYNDLNLPKV